MHEKFLSDFYDCVCDYEWGIEIRSANWMLRLMLQYQKKLAEKYHLKLSFPMSEDYYENYESYGKNCGIFLRHYLKILDDMLFMVIRIPSLEDDDSEDEEYNLKNILLEYGEKYLKYQTMIDPILEKFFSSYMACDSYETYVYLFLDPHDELYGTLYQQKYGEQQYKNLELAEDSPLNLSLWSSFQAHRIDGVRIDLCLLGCSDQGILMEEGLSYGFFEKRIQLRKELGFL